MKTSNTKTQSGQSVTEFIVMLVVMTPIFLLIPMIGKYSDMNHSTINASRYVAWERTIHSPGRKSEEQLQQEARKRFYTEARALIKTNEGPPADNSGRHRKLWVSHSQKKLLAKYSDVGTNAQNSTTPGTAPNIIGTLLDGIQKFGDIFFEGSFDLDTNGLYRGNVKVDVANVQRLRPLDNINLQFNRHNVILANTWDAEKPSVIETNVKGLTPFSAFDRFGLDTVTSGLGFLVPYFKNFKPGYVEPNVVPQDRLGPKPNN